MKPKLLIDQISRSYYLSRKAIDEDKLGINIINSKVLKSHKYLVYRIDSIISTLDDKDRFILNNEIILGKKGEWYAGYLSTPTYYRHRKEAYDNFLNCMNS